MMPDPVNQKPQWYLAKYQQKESLLGERCHVTEGALNQAMEKYVGQ